MRLINLLTIIVLLALTFGSGGVSPASAAPVTVISNIGNASTGLGSIDPGLQRAVGFTTPNTPYVLTSFTMYVYNWSLASHNVRAWLYSDNGGNPGAQLAAFTPISTTAGEDAPRTLTLASPYLLLPSTTYWIVADSDAVTRSDMVWRLTNVPPSGIFTYAGTRQNVDLGGWDASPNENLWSVQAVLASQLSASGTNVGGYVTESSETSQLGGSITTIGSTLMVGDQTLDRQVRAFLNFNNPTLPVGAIVYGASLSIKRQGVTGTNPFSTHGNLWVDIASPHFGLESALKRTDFQAASSFDQAAYFNPTPGTGNWHTAWFDAPALSFFNVAGTIQFRLRFNLDDNDDNNADLFRFFSGNYPNAAYRPVLTVYYAVPDPCAPVPGDVPSIVCAPVEE